MFLGVKKPSNLELLSIAAGLGLIGKLVFKTSTTNSIIVTSGSAFLLYLFFKETNHPSIPIKRGSQLPNQSVNTPIQPIIEPKEIDIKPNAKLYKRLIVRVLEPITVMFATGFRNSSIVTFTYEDILNVTEFNGIYYTTPTGDYPDFIFGDFNLIKIPKEKVAII